MGDCMYCGGSHTGMCPNKVGQPDPRDAEIARLQSQLVARDAELARLRALIEKILRHGSPWEGLVYADELREALEGGA